MLSVLHWRQFQELLTLLLESARKLAVGADRLALEIDLVDRDQEKRSEYAENERRP